MPMSRQREAANVKVGVTSISRHLFAQLGTKRND
jgi:hypothetical protein